jgi:glutathione S-transferase
MFFVNAAISDVAAKAQALQAAADGVSIMWAVVDAQLAKTKFVCGDKPSAADFLLTIYANWGVSVFPESKITLGENVKRMLKDISGRESYQKALSTENVPYKAAA